MRAIGLALALGGLMVVIDTTVTAVALAAIVSGLHASLPAAQWATAGYLLGLVAVIPLAGWLSGRFGARRVYLAALLVFTVFSAATGLAGDVTSLAVFRVMQGLGGGLLNPVGQAIGLRAAPREARGRLMSLLVLPLVIGPVLGPLLAGWLIDTASWRWIFLLNVPLGLLAALVCARVLPRDPATGPAGATSGTVLSRDPAPGPAGAEPGPVLSRAVRFRPGRFSALSRVRDRGADGRPDWGGLVLISGGAVTVVLGATLVDRPESAGFAAGLVLIVAGLGMLGGFAWRARRIAEPIVDLRLLRYRPVRAGAGVLICFGAAYFGSMAVLPLFVQGVRGDPASLVGVIGVPSAVAVGMVAQVATRLVDRYPARRIVLTGTAAGTLGGALLLAATVTDAGYPWIMAATVLVSAGSGATLMPTMTVALRDLDHAETPRGTTLLALIVQLSNALAGAVTAVTLSVLVTRALPGDGGGVPVMLALDEASRQALRPGLAAAVGAAYLLPVILLAGSWLITHRSLRPTPAMALLGPSAR
ncbi:MFS transporter [Actinoplanes philippinensis]|uniref:MFS transporter n=1 Tax=Actinoplanes philippinensis TaxID=35752 RepID=UPI001160917C|nr:MFS transporter [Actinoplanes philippinensis]